MLQPGNLSSNVYASSHNISRRGTFTLIPRETEQKAPATQTACQVTCKCKALLPREEKIQINVSGKRYQLLSRQLQKFPKSLLGDPVKRELYHDEENDEIFFDRNKTAFESVFNFYVTEGSLVSSNKTLSGQLVADELYFFGVYEYLSLNDKKNNLPVPRGLQRKKHVFLQGVYQKKVWEMCEVPDSSIYARVFNLFSLLVTVFAAVLICIASLPSVRNGWNSEQDVFNTAINHGSPMLKHNDTTSHNSSNTTEYFILKAEEFCIAWFTIELLARFLVSPEKRRFLLGVLNIIDIVAILPFYIALFTSSRLRVPVYILKTLRLSRIFQVLKLSRFTSAMKVVGKTARDCVYDLWTVVFLTFIGTVLFGITVYYCEQWDKETVFHSIPDACWWAVVTISTLGYGDMVPETLGEYRSPIFAAVDPFRVTW